MDPRFRNVALGAALVSLAASACTGARTAVPEPGVVHPGAPGEPARPAAPRAAGVALAHTEADVRFMQGMIPHHAQALEMTSLVAERTTSQDIRLLARRIEVAQAQEIELMQRWLRERGADVPAAGGGHAHGEHHHGDHGHANGGHGHHGHGHAAHGAGHDHHLMPGMLTAEEMRRLADARGAEFDRLFLQFMIRHHEGALVMVAELFAAPGAAQDSEIFQFAAEVDGDQRIEIDRMLRMLAIERG